jgi:hypothetical protein
VTAAAELFEERGYRRTRLDDIAEAAGVSVQSVQLNGPKPMLLVAALEMASVGQEINGTLTAVPDVSSAINASTSAESLIRWIAEFATASNQRVSGIWWALEHAAAEDGSVEDVLSRQVTQMRNDARRGIEALLALGGGQLKSPDQLADLLLALTLPDLYRRLVRKLGWSVADYTDWLERSLRFEILGLTSPSRPSKASP